MRKLFLLVLVCGVVLGFLSNGFAELYKSSKFPPADVLKKAISVKKWLGKRELISGEYKIWFKSKGGPIKSVLVEKLDSDIWIMSGIGIEDKVKVLKK